MITPELALLRRKIWLAIISLDPLKASEFLSVADPNESWVRDASSSIKFNESRIPESSLNRGEAKSADVAGVWVLTKNGEELTLNGHVFGRIPTVHIFVNRRQVRSLNTVVKTVSGVELSKFSISLKASVVKTLPKISLVSVGCSQGGLLHQSVNGVLDFEVRVDVDGTGEIFNKLKVGYFISKHGSLLEPLTGRPEWQKKILDAYVEFSTYFKSRFGYDLFVNYGSLLGLIRENDFIAHDDDFDVGYLSSKVRPEDVKLEMIEILRTMKGDGVKFTLAQHPFGAFFKVGKADCMIDVFPAWIEDGRLWMSNTTSVIADESLVNPIKVVPFKEVEVNVMNQSEVFLERKYGANWRTPDPGYQFAQKADGTEERLARARLTLEEAVGI